jgi:hypothetical protein
VWLQREIVSSVGLLDRLAFPGQDEAAMVADCVLNADVLVMSRLEGEDLPATFSGWALTCAADHDHGERHIVPLFAIAVELPALVQLLALPRGTSVIVGLREAAGGRRVDPHVFLNGEELAPAPGSYLAALQAAPEPKAAPAAPRSYPSHEYLGSFVLGDCAVVSDTRSDPPLEIAIDCLPGRWHVWVRVEKGGARAALMAVHEAHTDRANDEVLTYGGEAPALLASWVRSAGKAPTGDWTEDVKRVDPMLADLIRDCAAAEPEFVARWGGGPVSVMVSDEAAFDPTRRPSTEAGDAGLLGAVGCWARTSNDDSWSIYGVEEDGRVVVLRIRLTTLDDHKFLIDRKTTQLALALAMLPDAASSSSEVRPYSPRERYAVGDTLSHAKFGVGRVVASEGNKIDVVFEIGAKRLIQADR